MITVYENEVELEFDDGVASGYINFEAGDEGLVLTYTCGDSDSGMEEIEVVHTIDHEDAITLLEETLEILRNKVDTQH